MLLSRLGATFGTIPIEFDPMINHIKVMLAPDVPFQILQNVVTKLDNFTAF